MNTDKCNPSDNCYCAVITVRVKHGNVGLEIGGALLRIYKSIIELHFEYLLLFQKCNKQRLCNTSSVRSRHRDYDDIYNSIILTARYSISISFCLRLYFSH